MINESNSELLLLIITSVLLAFYTLYMVLKWKRLNKLALTIAFLYYILLALRLASLIAAYSLSKNDR
jgi:hypothetical protein